MVTIKAYTSCD